MNDPRISDRCCRDSRVELVSGPYRLYGTARGSHHAVRAKRRFPAAPIFALVSSDTAWPFLAALIFARCSSENTRALSLAIVSSEWFHPVRALKAARAFSDIGLPLCAALIFARAASDAFRPLSMALISGRFRPVSVSLILARDASEGLRPLLAALNLARVSSETFLPLCAVRSFACVSSECFLPFAAALNLSLVSLEATRPLVPSPPIVIFDMGTPSTRQNAMRSISRSNASCSVRF